MAYKILGQVHPNTIDNTDLYTVPSGLQTVISTLHMNNTASISSRATVYIRKSNAGTLEAVSLVNEFMTEIVISPGEPMSMTIGITLSEGDTITVRTETINTITFHAFGSETE